MINALRAYKNKVNLPNFEYLIPFPSLTSYLKLLLRDNKGCQNIYKVLIRNNEIPVSRQKWINLFPEFGEDKWKFIYALPYILTQDTNLRWFQYKLIHRILANNYFLHKIGIAESIQCTFCNLESETIYHLFWDCEYVKKLWIEILN